MNGNYQQLSGPTNTGGTGTTLTGTPLSPPSPIASLTPGSAAIFSAKNAVVSIANPSAAGQTINAATLKFTETIGGQTVTITYTLSTVSIGAGANQTFFVALTNGILSTPTVNVTYAANPSAATLAAQLVLLPT